MMWFEIKDWLELSTGLDRDSLHVYAGVGVQLGAAFCLRRSLASLFPWLCVVVAACGNEFYDYSFVSDAPEGSNIYFDEAVRDVWNTLLLPSLFLMIARFWPHWITGKAAAIGQSRDREGDRPPS